MYVYIFFSKCYIITTHYQQTFTKLLLSMWVYKYLYKTIFYANLSNSRKINNETIQSIIILWLFKIHSFVCKQGAGRVEHPHFQTYTPLFHLHIILFFLYNSTSYDQLEDSAHGIMRLGVAVYKREWERRGGDTTLVRRCLKIPCRIAEFTENHWETFQVFLVKL